MKLTSITPVRPPAPYLGGKRHLAKTIIERIAAIPHMGYAEPFVGMGGVFLRRPQKPRSEYINDLGGEVANLFRILQRHYPQLMEVLRFQITSRREFEHLSGCDPTTLTDLERAARFIYLQKTAFGAKPSGRNFGVDRSQSGRFNLSRIAPVLEDVHERMAGVTIEQLPWRRFIERYDADHMLFYLDPPYWGNERDYGADLFSRGEFEAIADVLADLKGRFILSLNDRPEVRECFAAFEIEAVEVPYTIAKNGTSKAKEMLITG